MVPSPFSSDFPLEDAITANRIAAVITFACDCVARERKMDNNASPNACVHLCDVSRRTPAGLEVDVLVSPRSNRSGPEGFDEWRKRLILRIKAPPLDGKANKEVEAMMGELSGRPAEIISGHLNRQKTVLILGDADAIFSVLGDRCG